MTVPAKTYSLEPYPVTEKETALCHNCGKLIVWLNSYRTGGKYPVETQVIDGQMKTARNWFHKCDKSATQLPLLSTAKPPATYSAPERNTKSARRGAMVSYIEQASASQLQKALAVIFKRQTLGEQVSKDTHVHNSIGFTGTDAFILSDIHTKAEKWGGLRGGQVELVRKKLKKYAKQLAEAMLAGEWTP